MTESQERAAVLAWEYALEGHPGVTRACMFTASMVLKTDSEAYDEFVFLWNMLADNGSIYANPA